MKTLQISEELRRRLLRFEVIGFIFTSVSAALLHYLYEWSGKELLTALFSAVNESIWEHTKIFSLPFVVWGFVELFCLRPPFRRFVSAKVFGLWVMITTIPVFHYAYTGIIGTTFAVVDIVSGFVFTLLAFYVSYRLTAYAPNTENYYNTAVFLFIIYCTMAAFFTLAPPNLNIFRDPETGMIGV